MLKKKVVALAGASVLTVSLLAGVTYAWFTNTQTATAGAITAGKLGITFSVADSSVPEKLYPQLTGIDSENYEYPDIKGTVDDVATKLFTLTNASDRKVLVKVSGEDFIVKSVKGSETDADGNAVEGSYPTELTDTSAVKIRYDFGDTSTFYRKGNDAYIFLSTGSSTTDVTVKVWIDGETGGNEYQNATIDFSDMTAKAVQYRKDAINAEFDGLDEADFTYFATNFAEFE